MAVTSDPGPPGSSRGLPRPPLRGRQPMRHPRQEGHHHAKGHPAGEADTRGLGRRRGMIPQHPPCMRRNKNKKSNDKQQQRMKGVFPFSGGGVPGVRMNCLLVRRFARHGMLRSRAALVALIPGMLSRHFSKRSLVVGGELAHLLHQCFDCRVTKVIAVRLNRSQQEGPVDVVMCLLRSSGFSCI